MNAGVKRYLSEIGRRGGQKSKRKLTKTQARAMVLARMAKRALGQANDPSSAMTPTETSDCNESSPASFAEAHGWAVGEIWETPPGHLMQVVEILEDGCAMIQMLKPFRLRPCKQKQIPVTWKLKNNL